MIPVRTRASNYIYRGDGKAVQDAWVRRVPEHSAVVLTWKLSDQERAAIAAGANIDLAIYGMDPIPPTSMAVSRHAEISALGAIIRDRAIAEVARHAGAHEGNEEPRGFFLVSGDVFEDMAASEACDPTEGESAEATLFGLPVVVDEKLVTGSLVFQETKLTLLS